MVNYGYSYDEARDIFLNGAHKNENKVSPKIGNIGGIKLFFSKIYLITIMYNYFMEVITVDPENIFKEYNTKRLDYSKKMFNYVTGKSVKNIVKTICPKFFPIIFFNTCFSLVIFGIPSLTMAALNILGIVSEKPLEHFITTNLIVSIIWFLTPILVFVLILIIYAIIVIISIIAYVAIYVGGMIFINIYLGLLHYDMLCIIEIFSFLYTIIKLLGFIFLAAIYLIFFVIITPFVLTYNIIYCSIIFIFWVEVNVSRI